MTITFANKDTIIHKGDGHQFIAMTPDVCKTPSPGGPVPIPYPNFAFTSDLADGSSTVKVEGNPAALASSNLSTSTGDEAGTAGGGIISSKIKGKVTWMSYSTDVKFEGKGVVRFFDSNMHNGNKGNDNGKNKGRFSYPGGGGNIKCDICGKQFDDPSHVQMKPSAESNKAARDTKGRTKAAVVVECKGKKPAAFTGVAGNMYSSLNQNTFAKLAKNFKTGRPIPPKAASDGNAEAGNCAEQKALYEAHKAGAIPPGPGCTASMSAVREKEGAREDPHVEACDTCKRILTSMLCTNDPK